MRLAQQDVAHYELVIIWLAVSQAFFFNQFIIYQSSGLVTKKTGKKSQITTYN